MIGTNTSKAVNAAACRIYHCLLRMLSRVADACRDISVATGKLFHPPHGECRFCSRPAAADYCDDCWIDRQL
jgi:hypothetical protein